MIIYFSGTGNSKYVAERLAKEFKDRILSIEEAFSEINLSDGEFLGIVSPVYWWQVPPIMIDFLEKLNIKNSAYTFFVATCGGSSGFCGTDMKRILKSKGIALSAAFSVKMPDTWTPIFDLSDVEKVTKINRLAENHIERLIVDIKNRRRGNRTKGRFPYIFHYVMDILLEKSRMTKNFYVEDSCISCGDCAKKCPMGAIKIIDGKPVWVKEKCTLCLRCLHYCPKFSIQYGKGKTKYHGQYRNPNTVV